MKRPYESLSSQFVRVNRTIVRDGTWSAIWASGGKAAIKLLPVTLLLARNYVERGAFAKSADLQSVTGLSHRSLLAAFQTLSDFSLVQSERATSRAPFRLRLTNRLLKKGGRFSFPGRLVSSGQWGALTPQGSSLLFALGADVEPFAWNPGEANEIVDDLISWVAEDPDYNVGELGFAQEGEVARLSKIRPERMEALTGMNAGDVAGALRDLCDLRLIKCRWSGTWWVYLPSDVWPSRFDWSGTLAP